MNKKSLKDGKSGSPKVVKKSEVGRPKSERENNSAPNSYWDDIPITIGTNSELNESEIKNKSDIEHPTSEIENNSEIENGEALNEVNPASEINPK